MFVGVAEEKLSQHRHPHGVSLRLGHRDPEEQMFAAKAPCAQKSLYHSWVGDIGSHQAPQVLVPGPRRCPAGGTARVAQVLFEVERQKVAHGKKEKSLIGLLDRYDQRGRLLGGPPGDQISERCTSPTRVKGGGDLKVGAYSPQPVGAEK